MKRIALLLLALLLAPLVVAPALAQASLSASDQTVRGTTITVDSAMLEQDGFIVVHATDAGGNAVLTPPLGLTYLEAGMHENVAIELDPAELAKYSYGAMPTTVVPMLHIDDGNGTYEFPDGPDVPVVVDGGALVAPLSLTLAPFLATMDQTLANDAITVDTVIANQDGFVVVHALDLNGDAVIAPPLGLAPVEAGVNRFVSIALDPMLLAEYGYDAGPKAVVPMLHIDDGNGTYEFPDGPDVPVMADGGALVSPLQLSMATMGTPEVQIAESQTLDVTADGLAVTLPSVTLTQPGFVVLHAADADGNLVGVPVLGVSPALDAGTHENVTIDIAGDQAPVVGDTVFAMVHVDDGDGAYTFPASDGPFMVDGAPFVVPFTLK